MGRKVYNFSSPRPVELKNEAVIREEKVKTGGHLQAKGFDCSIPANVGWNSFDFTFPIDINVLGAYFSDRSEIAGDKVEFQIAPDTIIGTITSDISINDSEISVSSSVLENIQVGFWAKVDSEDFGMVTDIDHANSKLTIENQATTTHTSGSYFKFTLKSISYLKFTGKGNLVNIGQYRIGGSYIAKNTTLRLKYYNSVATAKEFNFILEYLY